MINFSSLQNPRIKSLVRLQEKAQERRREKKFVVEGQREIRRAIECGYPLQELFFLDNPDWPFTLQSLRSISSHSFEIFEVNKQVFEKIAYRETTENLVGVFNSRELLLSHLKLGSNPFILVLEAIEKPGNLGAMLRTADGAGVDAVILCDPKADVYNPNVIRASTGCLFSVPLAICNSQEALQFLRERNIKIFTASPDAENLLYDLNLTKSGAFVLGTEAEGLSDFWLKDADYNFKLPMLGKADSLNVSVAAGIILYEVARQRMQ